MNSPPSKSLAVVIGAGASFDCVSNEPNTTRPENRVTTVDPDYKPHLTKDLFAPQLAFNKILDKYPLVSSLSEEIRARIRKSKTGQPQGLEQILKELAASASFDTKKHVWEIPLYLQELFWTISDKYIISGRSKFSTLVRRVLDSSYGRVMFLTLNYDLFLDRAISEYASHRFTSMASYLPAGKKWFFVKAHGSVNWARTIDNGPDFNGDHDGFVSQLTTEPRFSSETQVLLGGSRERNTPYAPQLRYGQKFVYPWMALPAEGDKNFYCPDEHIYEAKVFLQNCDNFLFIGFSGLDAHIVELFKDVSRSHRLM